MNKAACVRSREHIMVQLPSVVARSPPASLEARLRLNRRQDACPHIFPDDQEKSMLALALLLRQPTAASPLS